jgi:phospholipid transport system substrate-binding protein
MTIGGLQMFGRRRLAGFAVALGVLAPVAARADDADQAEKFIDKLLKDLSTVVNGGKPVDAQKAAMRQIVYDAVDVDGVARFCLGRFWRTATPQQQKDYTEIFRNVMVSNITSKVGEYQGVSFAMGKAQIRPDDISVSSVVNRPGNAPNKVDWLVAITDGKPRVIDVIAEGTSLRLTQRSDYGAFLSRNNNDVQALIDALKKQALAAN